MSSSGAGPKDFKRSNSLFDNPKKPGFKRQGTMDASVRSKKSSKITDNDSDDDGPTPDKKTSYVPPRRL